MRIFKPAISVKSECSRHIACSHRHLRVFSRIMDAQVTDQPPAISLPLESGSNSYIFEFTNPIPFISDHPNRFHPLILQYEQLATFQITVNHRLLLVGKQEQIQVLFLIFSNLSNCHFE